MPYDDLFTFFENDQPVRSEADTNGDGRPDTFVTFRGGVRVAQEEDRNHDGDVDARYRYAADGEALASQELDEDFDGRFETTVRYAAGEVQGKTGPHPFLFGAAHVIAGGGTLVYAWVNQDYHDNAPNCFVLYRRPGGQIQFVAIADAGFAYLASFSLKTAMGNDAALPVGSLSPCVGA